MSRANITTQKWGEFLNLLKFKMDCHNRALAREDSAFAIKLYYEIMAMLDAVQTLQIITEEEREQIESQLYH